MTRTGQSQFFTPILMALIAIGSLLTALGIFLYNNHQEEHQHAQVSTRNLAWVLEKHAKATFEKVDIVLQNVADHVRAEGQRANGSSFPDARHELQALWRSIPETVAVRITDPRGNILFSSGDHIPDINVGDRSYFINAKQDAYGRLIISEPLISRTSNTPIIVLSRRLELPDGRFAGIVYAPIRVEFFLDFYRSLDLGPHGLVEMNALDGHTALLRYSPRSKEDPTRLTAPVKKTPVQHFLERGETTGTFHTLSPSDQIARTISFRHISSFPYYILVGRADQDYLAAWKEKALILTSAATLLSLLIALLARQVWRVQQREHEISENLKRAQAVSHLGSWNLDLTKNQLTCSDETLKIFGLPPNSPVSHGTIIEQTHPDDRGWVVKAWQAALKGDTYDLEHRILVKGEAKWVHQKALLSFDLYGRPTAAIGTVRDITEQKLNEQRQRLAVSVFSNSHDGIVITSPDNRIIDVNQAFCEVTGYSREEVIGKNPSLLNSGRQDTHFYQDMWQTLKNAGHWSGEIWNRKKNGEPYVELLSISAVADAQGRITHYVGVFSDITSLRSSQQRLEHLAHFDALTHLPNRILLADRLQQDIAHTVRHEQLLAICFIDLDDFKPVNDKYGHDIGDMLLIEVSSRLKEAVRTGDTVARLGGDEFVLLLTDLNAMEELEAILSRILLNVSAPFMLAGHEIHISASIGVTMFPLDGSDSDVLLRHADQAMYAAKQSGRNRYHMFDAEQDRLVRVRREHLDRLQEALSNGEFRLHYQPKVNMRTGQVIGAEALIRWQHPEQGLLLPGRFLPLAEESELIIKIGEWVLREALQQMGLWAAAGLTVPVSVNIAIKHLQQADFLKQLKRILAEYPEIPPSWLELEILETTALANMAHAQTLIEGCRRLGVSFALDDFGTGYSSLSYLKRLSANTLKIDQSFIRDMLEDPEALAIVEGVIGLTTAFQRSVIAEGVETSEHGVMLMRLGCDLAQGYGIARPMDGERLPEWIRQFQPEPSWQDNAALHWNREEYPLLTVSIDHKRWVGRILHALEKEPPHTPIELVDHHHCRFGRWHDGIGMKYYGSLPEFKQIEPLHARVHSLGRKIILMRDTGNMDEARALAKELEQERDQVLDLLSRLQIAVALSNDWSVAKPTQQQD